MKIWHATYYPVYTKLALLRHKFVYKLFSKIYTDMLQNFIIFLWYIFKYYSPKMISTSYKNKKWNYKTGQRKERIYLFSDIGNIFHSLTKILFFILIVYIHSFFRRNLKPPDKRMTAFSYFFFPSHGRLELKRFLGPPFASKLPR